MKEMQKLLSRVRCAADRYSMIDEGDLVAVGVSGGKDSLALLCALAQLREFYPKKFDVVALMLDMGFDKSESISAPSLRPFRDRGALPQTARRLSCEADRDFAYYFRRSPRIKSLLALREHAQRLASQYGEGIRRE